MRCNSKETSSIEEELFDDCGYFRTWSTDREVFSNSRFSRIYFFLRCLIKALVQTFRFALDSPKKRSRTTVNFLFIYLTENQRRAYQNWVKWSQSYQTASFMKGADRHISWRDCGLLSIRYLWSTYCILRSRSDHHLTIPWLGEFVRYRVGLVLAERLYRNIHPQVVVFANDHSGILRAFIRRARELGCKTVYTQHASIGRSFPPLDFDLALLDGNQACHHYIESGPVKGHVVITGRNTCKPQSSTDDCSGGNFIGLATNELNSLKEWIYWIKRLKQLDRKLLLRCHPADKRKIAWRLICRWHGIEFDSSTLNDYLSRCRFLLTGMSGIILEAALKGVPSLAIRPPKWHSQRMLDYYSYERFGLVKGISRQDTNKQLFEHLSQISQDRVGFFEAGMVLDPPSEKNKIIKLLENNLRSGEKIESQLDKNYDMFFVYDDNRIYCSSNYKNFLNDTNYIAIDR